MFGMNLYDILFFAIPVGVVVSLGISAYRYFSAKKQNKAAPGTFAPEEIIKRKTLFIVLAVVAGILAMVVIGFIVLLFLAVAYM